MSPEIVAGTLGVLGVLSLVLAARAAWNAWIEMSDARRMVRRRREALPPDADPLEIFDVSEIDMLTMGPQGRSVPLSRWTGWVVQDPRVADFSLPPPLLPVYANRLRDAADVAAIVCDVVLLIVGATFGYLLSFLVASYDTGVDGLPVVLGCIGLLMVGLLAGVVRVRVVREWANVASHYRRLATQQTAIGADSALAPTVVDEITRAVTAGLAEQRRRRTWFRR